MCQICKKFGMGVTYGKLLSKLEFCDNRLSDIFTLIKGIPRLSIRLVQFG